MSKKQIKATDAFGFLAGVIGLVADVAGLGGLIIISKVGQGSEFLLWAFLFLSIIYSTALVNFFARKHLFDSYKGRVETLSRQIESECPQNDRIALIIPTPSKIEKRGIIYRVESGATSFTLIAGLPVMILLCVCITIYSEQ